MELSAKPKREQVQGIFNTLIPYIYVFVHAFCCAAGVFAVLFFIVFQNIYFKSAVGDLEGKVIWITGASSGIGEAIALYLAKAKVKLILSARSEDKLHTVKDRCMEDGVIGDDDILVLPFDMTDYSKHEWALSAVIKQFGKIDILISNAGRSQRAQWEKIEVPVDRAVFDLNVFSLIALCRIVTRYFMSVGGGQHVVMSSAAGKVGVPMSASYTGSKHAIMGYFECMRAEHGSKGIGVTLLCPGPVESNLMAGCLGEKLGDSLPLNRTVKMMTAERCAELSVTAIANNLSEVWIAQSSILLFMYLWQYNPTLIRWVMNHINFSSAFMKQRDGKHGISSKSD